MTPYLYILGGVGIFLVAAAMVNIVFINWFRYSYAKNYIFFTALYVLFTTVLLLTTDLFEPILTLSNGFLCVAMLVAYPFFGYYFDKNKPRGTFVHLFKIPKEQKAMLAVTTSSCFVKVWEILIQQLVAYLVVTGLLLFEFPLWLCAIVFASIVCLVHYPGLRLFGSVFGKFFLWASTIISFFYPFLMQYPEYGWGIMVVIHTTAYVIWYTFVLYKMKKL